MPSPRARSRTGANVIFGGTWGGKAIAIVAMISIFGVLNGWILLQGRAPLGAAQDGLFPKPFARVDGKRGTPVFGLVVSSVLITGLLLLNLRSSGTLVDWFTDIIIIATLTALIPYMLAATAQLYLFFTDRASFSGVHFARYSVIAVLALAYSTWAIWGAGADPVRKGLMLLIAGIRSSSGRAGARARRPRNCRSPRSLHLLRPSGRLRRRPL